MESFGVMDEERRSILLGGLCAAVAFALPARLHAGKALPGTDAHPVDKDALTALLAKTFQSDDPGVMKLVTDAYLQCVVEKIQPPDPPLEHNWLAPGGAYLAQWVWDTVFVLDLLALLPGQQQIIRGVFQNYWDFQRRWNEAHPPCMNGMIANFIAPFDGNKYFPGKEWKTFPAFSQAPLLAWGMERIYRKNGDLELIRQGLRPLEEFHEWYWRERDVSGCGLIGVGAYSGDVQHARFETYDHEVDLDNLKMTLHPKRSGSSPNGAWYGDILIPANSSYLLLSEAALARMAELAGDHEMSGRRRKRFAAGVKAMRTHMWSQKNGCFLAVRRTSMEMIESPTVGSFVPLMAGIPTQSQAKAMAAALDTPAWATPLPVPTVAASNPNFLSSAFWRGDVWPAPNFQIATGLKSYGLTATANRISDLCVENAIKVGISERYDSLSGAPLGVGGLGMSATVITMMLDGLTKKFKLRRLNS